MSGAELERLSFEDLGRIVREAREWGFGLALMGGYAVRAYTRAYRFTKD